jgi:hypothetical protein
MPAALVRACDTLGLKASGSAIGTARGRKQHTDNIISIDGFREIDVGAIAFELFGNVSVSTNTVMKKSKASSAQPRKLAATTCFGSLVQPDSAAIGIEFSLFVDVRKPTAAQH